MKRCFKKLARGLALAAGAAAIAACSNDVDGTTADRSATPITFRTYAKTTDNTRSDQVTAKQLDAFSVYSLETVGAVSARLFGGTAVSWNGSAYTYSPIVYWPGDVSGDVSFIAMSPLKANGVSGWYEADTGTSATDVTAHKTFNYTIPNPLAANADAIQQDLMIACATVTEANRANPVALDFKHVLSRIRFAFTNTTASPLEIRSIRYYAPATVYTGNVIDPSTTSVTWATGASATTPAVWDILKNTWTIQPGTSTAEAQEANQGFYIVPAMGLTTANGSLTKTSTLATPADADKGKIEIEYKLNNIHAFKLATPNITVAAGTEYLITYNFTGTAVEFGVSVTGWTSGTGSVNL